MGFAAGSACYSTIQEAAAATCAAVSGSVSADGVYSCSWSTGETSTNQVGIGLEITNATGTTTTQVWSPGVPCEAYDMEFWTPVLAAFFLALVAILAIRMVFTKTFGRDTL